MSWLSLLNDSECRAWFAALIDLLAMPDHG